MASPMTPRANNANNYAHIMGQALRSGSSSGVHGLWRRYGFEHGERLTLVRRELRDGQTRLLPQRRAPERDREREHIHTNAEVEESGRGVG